MADDTVWVVETRKIDEILRKLQGQHVRIVADGVEYGVYWELGHITGSGAFLQHPFLAPAIALYAKPLEEALQQAMDRGDLVLVDNVLDLIAQKVADQAKKEIGSLKDKGNGVPSDLVDTGALMNSIIVVNPEGSDAGI